MRGGGAPSPGLSPEAPDSTAFAGRENPACSSVPRPGRTTWPNSHPRFSAGRPARAGPFAAPLPSQRGAPLFPASRLPAAFRGLPAWSPPPRGHCGEPREGLWAAADASPHLRSCLSAWRRRLGARSRLWRSRRPPSRPFRVLFCVFRLLSAPSPLKNKKNVALSPPVTLPPSRGSKDSRPPRPPRCVASLGPGTLPRPGSPPLPAFLPLSLALGFPVLSPKPPLARGGGSAARPPANLQPPPVSGRPGRPGPFPGRRVGGGGGGVATSPPAGGAAGP